MTLTDRVFRDRINSGQLGVVDHNSNRKDYGSSDTPVVVKFNKKGTLMRILRNPGLHLGECYMNGEVDILEGSLTDLLRILRSNLSDIAALNKNSLLKKMGYLVQSWNSIAASFRNVSFHYDIEPELYRGFLDENMHYSCAYFENANMSLEEAQQAKCRHLMKKLQLQPGQRVLDIGCGWGSLAIYLAENAGVEVTGVTVSKNQLDVANQRVRDRNLDNQVQFKYEDYRQHEGQYDAIVSVGMFEHVGKQYYDTYFTKVRSLLKENGVAVIHTIGSSAEPSPTNPWIKRYIFPGGYIPSLSEVTESVESTFLRIADVEVWRQHYARTLENWNERFQDIRESIQQKKGERFCRMWEFYLSACQTAFELDSLVVFQLQLSHKNDTVPLSRNYLYT